MKINQLDKTNLELLVDQIGLDEVLSALADISGEKGEHLRVNWQDRGAAKLWDQFANRLESLAAYVRREQ